MPYEVHVATPLKCTTLERSIGRPMGCGASTLEPPAQSEAPLEPPGSPPTIPPSAPTSRPPSGPSSLVDDQPAEAMPDPDQLKGVLTDSTNLPVHDAEDEPKIEQSPLSLNDYAAAAVTASPEELTEALSTLSVDGKAKLLDELSPEVAEAPMTLSSDQASAPSPDEEIKTLHNYAAAAVTASPEELTEA
eukprot:1973906-Prymnesium_polylepis.1